MIEATGPGDAGANVGVDSGATEATTSWYFAEGVPGVGEAPEFLDSRYKTLSDQAKAYKELERKFSATSGAPEEYDLGAFNEFKDDPSMQDLLSYAKEQKLSQEATDKFFKTFEKLSPPIDLDQEKLMLGEGADVLIDTVGKWANNNLSGDDLQTAVRISATADGVKFLNAMRLKSLRGGSQPPQDWGANAPTPAKSFKDVKLEMESNMDKWMADKSYRAEMNRKLTEAAEREGLQ